jgi:hypothetical protein
MNLEFTFLSPASAEIPKAKNTTEYLAPDRITLGNRKKQNQNCAGKRLLQPWLPGRLREISPINEFIMSREW